MLVAPLAAFFSQGALDGGLDIPHSEKRFIGYQKDKKAMDAEMMSSYIYGGPVAEFMESMEEDEPERYQSHFASYISEGVEYGNLEDMYKEVRKTSLLGVLRLLRSRSAAPWASCTTVPSAAVRRARRQRAERMLCVLFRRRCCAHYGFERATQVTRTRPTLGSDVARLESVPCRAIDREASSAVVGIRRRPSGCCHSSAVPSQPPWLLALHCCATTHRFFLPFRHMQQRSSFQPQCTLCRLCAMRARLPCLVVRPCRAAPALCAPLPAECLLCLRPPCLVLLRRQVHAAIRANPVAKPAQKKKPAQPKTWQAKKSTYEERKARLKAKLAALAEQDDE